MIPLKNILPVTTVKRNLMKILNELNAGEDHIIITKDGKASGVLMSADEYEGLLETLAIMSDKKTMKALKKSEDDIKNGRVYSYEQDESYEDFEYLIQY